MNDIALGITHITDWQGYDHMLYLLALVARYDLRHAGKAALAASMARTASCAEPSAT